MDGRHAQLFALAAARIINNWTCEGIGGVGKMAGRGRGRGGGQCKFGENGTAE